MYDLYDEKTREWFTELDKEETVDFIGLQKTEWDFMKYDRTSNDFIWPARLHRTPKTSSSFKRFHKTEWNFEWLGEVSEDLVGVRNFRRFDEVSEIPWDVERFQKTFCDSRRLHVTSSDLMRLRKTSVWRNCESGCLCLSARWCLVLSAHSQPCLSYITKVLYRRRSGHTW